MSRHTLNRAMSVAGVRRSTAVGWTLAGAVVLAIAATGMAPLGLPVSADSAPALNTGGETSSEVSPSATEMVRLGLRGVHFVPNHGQWEDDTVIFGFRTRGLDIAFRESSLRMHLRREKRIHHGEHGAREEGIDASRIFLEPDNDCAPEGDGRGQGRLGSLRDLDEHIEFESLVLEVTFPGSNMVIPRAAKPRTAKFNYFVGEDETKWASDVPSYGILIYENLYDGIDLHIMGSTGNDGVLKYEFHCAPGSDHTQIKVRYDGVDALGIEEETGDLLIETPFGTLRDTAPRVWQEDPASPDPEGAVFGSVPPQPLPHGRGSSEDENRSLTLPARFEALDAITYTITLLTQPDQSLPLVIDPEIEWMTYLGGSGGDYGHGVAVDGAGNALVTGWTDSTNFAGRNNSYYGARDVFALKVNPSGQLEWMTYLGGSSDEFGGGIDVDSADNALVTGWTDSTDFAGRNNSHRGGFRDAFALKITPSGQLQWMYYLGGSREDFGLGIAVDGADNALVSGWTDSTNFAGRNNSYYGNGDAFAVKVSPSGQVQWMTYLGGSSLDRGYSIAMDSADNALVTGLTWSNNFAGRNNSHYGQADTFALRVSPSGQVQWMTYLGGSSDEFGYGIAVDSADSALVTGWTDSTNFAGRNNSYYGARDAFALKVNPSGQLEWMTYLGGSSYDDGRGIVVDSADNALVTGPTSSSDFEGRDNSHYGQNDAFALKVSPSGQLEWMTYLGGSDGEVGFGTTADGAGNALVTGYTSSANFAGANNSSYGGDDAFILKIPAEITLDLDIVSPPIVGGEASSDPWAYGASSFPSLVGYAADGVTRIVARLTTPGPGTVSFTIRDENNNISSAVGTIRRLDGSGLSNTGVTTQTVNILDQDWAFVILQSPTDFSRSSADHDLIHRIIKLKADFTPGGGGGGSSQTLEVQLHRPPVLLLHGLWSGPGTWQYSLTNDPRFHVYRGQHDGVSGLEQNTGVARSRVLATLADFRAAGHVEAAQVDCVAHSMGGLLLRLYAGDFWPQYPYTRNDNYNAGDINRLITVDTPHRGARLAHWLVKPTNEATWLGQRFEDQGLSVTGGAVFDMRLDSQIIETITAAPVPAHAIVGKGGSDLMQEAALQLAPDWLGTAVSILSMLGILEDLFPPTMQHDFLISRPNQEGGLLNSQTTRFGYEILPPTLGIHVTVTKEIPVADRVITLLNTPTTDSSVFAPEFPGGPMLFGEDPPPPLPDLRFEVEGLVITDPPGGGKVNGGDTVEVTVERINDFLPQSVVISGQFQSVIVKSPPYTALLDVPADLIGAFEITAFGVDEDLDYANAGPLVFTVQTSASLLSLEVDPDPVRLFSHDPVRQLLVTGVYDDDVLRDLSGSIAGTTYQPTDPRIALVDAEGVVRALCVGATEIIVRNGDVETTVAVDVMSVGPHAELVDFEVAFGTHLSGELIDLCASDDQYLRTRSDFGFTAQEPNVMEIRFGAQTGVESPSSINLTVESRINNPSGTAKVRLKSWSTGLFQQVHQYPIGIVEEVEVIGGLAATDRVRADGRLELSIKHVVIATFSLSGFNSFFDWVQVLVN